MRCAADFRAEARAALKGRWGLAIGIGFLAMVLGGFTSMGLPEITLRFEGGDLQIALEALGQTLHPLDMIAGGTLLVGLGVIIVLGWLVRMLIGMIVTVGYMKFNMDLWRDWRRGNAVSVFSAMAHNACGRLIAGGVYHRLDAAVHYSGDYCDLSLFHDKLHSGGKS